MLGVPTSPVPQRGVRPATALVAFVVVLAAFVAIAFVSRQPDAPRPAASDVARATASLAAPATGTPLAPTPTPLPTPIPPCEATGIRPVASPMPRHPAELEPTGFEALTAAAGTYTSYAADRDGSLWAYGEGHLLHLDSSGSWRTWTFADDARFDATDIAAAGGGGVWIVGAADIAWFNGSGLLDVIAAPDGVADLLDATEASDGALWVTEWSGGVWRWDGVNWARIADCAMDSGPLGRALIAADPGGGVWVSHQVAPDYQTAPVVVSHLVGATWQHYGAMDAPSLTGFVMTLVVGPDGSAWIGTAQGLTRITNGRATSFEGLGAAAISVAPDPSGFAWIETGHVGWGVSDVRILRMPADELATTPAAPERIDAPREYAVGWGSPLGMASGRLYASGADGLVRLEGKRWRTIVPGGGPPPPNAVAAVSRSSAWVAGATGAWRLDGTRWRSVVPVTGATFVQDVAIGPDGVVWLAGLADGITTSTAPGNVRLAPVSGSALAVAENGAAWVWSASGSVDRVEIRNNLLVTATILTPPFADIQTIAAGADGAVWIGSSTSNGGQADGLARYDGDGWTQIDLPGDGLRGTIDITVAPSGDVWVALIDSASGRSFVGRQHDGRWTIFEPSDGIPSSIAAIAVGADGTVFVSGDGLTRFDGRRWDVLAPGHWFGPLSVARDGTLFIVGPSGLLRLPAGARPHL